MSELQKMITLKINKAHSSLKVAELLFDNCYYDEAVNRIYYAAFYAVQAALLKKGIKPTTHKGVQQMFGLHYVKTLDISAQYGAFYSSLFQMRQISDYADFSDLNEEVTKLFLKEAKQFIIEIHKLFNQ